MEYRAVFIEYSFFLHEYRVAVRLFPRSIGLFSRIIALFSWDIGIFFVEYSIIMRLFSWIYGLFMNRARLRGHISRFMEYGSLFTGYGAFLVEYSVATHCHIFHQKSPVSQKKRSILYVDIGPFFGGICGIAMHHILRPYTILLHCYKSILIRKAPGTLDLPQTSRANPVQCYSTHLEKQCTIYYDPIPYYYIDTNRLRVCVSVCVCWGGVWMPQRLGVPPAHTHTNTTRTPTTHTHQHEKHTTTRKIHRQSAWRCHPHIC